MRHNYIKFFNNTTGTPIFNSNVLNGRPFTINEFKNSVGYKLLLILPVPSSFLTLSAMYNEIIGLSSRKLLNAIALIMSQSTFLGFDISLLVSNAPENMSRKTMSINKFCVWKIKWYK